MESKELIEETKTTNSFNENEMSHILDVMDHPFKPKKKQGRKIPTTISEEEFLDILKITRQPHHKIAFILGFYGAMRVSEIVKLKQENIDKGQRIIRIKDAKGKKDRNIPIPPQAMKGIKHIPIKCGVRALQIAIKDKASTAIDKDIHFHSLRHSLQEDAEILTVDGWKDRKQLKIGDEIYSYNIQKDIIENDIVLDKYSYFCNDEELYHIKNKYIDCIFTPEHKTVLKYSRIKQKNHKRKDVWNDWHLITIKDLCDIKSLRSVQHKLSGIKKGGLSIGKAKAGLLGWCLTDSRLKKGKTFIINQSLTANKKKCEYISKLLKESGLRFTETIDKPRTNAVRKTPYQIKHWHIQDSRWIFEWIKHDKSPKWKLLQLKDEELEELLKCMMMADGSRGSEFCSQKKNLIEFFQTLGHLTGRRVLLEIGRASCRERV